MRSILFTLLVLLSSSEAFADLSAEVGISISNEKINNFLKELPSNLKVEDKEIMFDGGSLFKELKKSRAAISIDAEINIQLEGDNRASADVNFKDFELSLENFYYQNITTLRRSGIRAKVKTTISCSVLYISLKDWAGTLISPVHFDGKTLKLNKEDGEFELSGSDISIDLSQCKAPKGVDVIFKLEIIEWLKSKEGRDLLFEQALIYGQQFIDDNWEKIKKEDMSFELLGNKFAVDLSEIVFFKDHIQAKGFLNVVDKNKNYFLKLEEGAVSKLRTEAGIILPKEFFSKLIPEIIAKSQLAFEMQRAEIPGVDFLFNSRFIQFFVWSDLLNFRKDANFKARISLQKAKLNLVSNLQEGFSYGFAGNHSVDMTFLNRSGYHFPYMMFTGAVRGDLNLKLTNEGFAIKINETDLSAKSSWHSFMKFWRKSKTKGKPWMKMILPRVTKAFKGKVFEYSWAEIGLGGFIEGVEIEHLQESVILNVGLK